MVSFFVASILGLAFLILLSPDELLSALLISYAAVWLLTGFLFIVNRLKKDNEEINRD